MTSTRVVAFGSVSLEVVAHGAEAERVAAFACKHLASGDPARVVVSLLACEADGAFDLRGDTEAFRAPSAGLLLEQLVRRITFHLIDTNASGLTMHAGMVSRHGGALLMPGVSGAGKSTLTTHLVRRGYALATDELAMLPETLPDGERIPVFGLPRPIHLKPKSLFMTRGIEASPEVVRFEDGAFVHAEALGSSVVTHPETLAAIVFPRYDATAQRFSPLSAASATRELMGSLVNARNLAGHGFSAMAAIARRVPAYSLTYHDFAFAEEHLATLTARGAARAKSAEPARGSLPVA